MKLEDIKTITVLGSGVMGHGIAQGFLMGGYPVKLYDINASVLEVASSHIRESLTLFCEADIFTLDEIEEIMSRLSTTVDLKEAVEDSDFIMEVIPEIMALKQKTFKEVESYCKKESIFASNTSHLKLSDVFSLMEDQSHVVGAHYFNPPQICPTVEVVKGTHTSDETMQTTYDLMKKIGKEPVKVNKDVVGLVVNRLQTALLREAFYLHEEDVISAEDIDKAVRGSLGFRAATIGPMAMVDMGGLDAWLDCCEKLLPIMDNSTAPPRALKKLVDDGHDGIKTGRGFYEYAVNFSQKGLDDAVKKRDREFLERYKKHFMEK
jgi:3-hydroxyacyl-CoA dehydrogenase